MYSHSDNDNCDPDPCQNGGRCSNSGGGYLCHCVKGYVGTHCESNILLITPFIIYMRIIYGERGLDMRPNPPVLVHSCFPVVWYSNVTVFSVLFF